MKRVVGALILALGALVSAETPVLAADCCYWCEEGVCIPQQPGGPGYTICISTYDPVGCMVNAGSHCTATYPNPCAPLPNDPLTTLTAVFKLNPDATDRLFGPNEGARIVQGPKGAFNCSAVAGLIGDLANVSGRPADLAFWHFTVSGAARSFGAEENAGSGYLLRVSPDWVGRTRLAVHAAKGANAQQELADTRMTPRDILLVRVEIGGEEYVLATSAHTVPQGDLRSIQESFRQSVIDYPNKHRIDLRLIGAQEAEEMFL